MIVDINKSYTTYDDLEVKIYSDKGAPGQEIHGAVYANGQWRAHTWARTGSWLGATGERHLNNLKEVRRQISVSRWFNIYDKGFGTPYLTQEEANEGAMGNRLACVEVFINCLEGDGL